MISKSAETKISAATCDASPTATGYGLGDLAESQRSEPSLSTAGFSHDTAQCVANGMQCVAQHASPDQAPLHLEGQTGLCMTYGVDSPRCKPHRINTNIPLVEELSFLTSTASAYTDGSVPWTDSSDSSYDSPSSFFLLTPEGGNSDLQVRVLLPIFLKRANQNHQGGNRDIMEYNGAMPHELDVGSFLPESIGEQSSEPLSKSDDPYVNYLAPFTSNGFTYQPSTGSLFTPSIAGFDTECTIPHIDPLHNQQFALPIDHSVISGQPLDETSTCIFQFPRSPATSFTPQESDVAHMLCSGSMLNPQFLSYHIV